MNWEIEYLPESQKELLKLDGSVKAIILKGINKVSENPLPKKEGGFGEPLGNYRGVNLTGLLKIKYRNEGIRVIYKLYPKSHVMEIIIISVRSEYEVYNEAFKRRIRYDL